MQAPAGFGKTTLLQDLAQQWGAAVVTGPSAGPDEVRASTTLLLDDVDHVAADTLDALLDTIAADAPDGALVLAGRTIPGALAAVGAVLRADVLAFDPTDAAALAGARGLELDRDAAEALVDATDGWPVVAATAVAALAGHGGPTTARAAAAAGRLALADEAGRVLERAGADATALVALAPLPLLAPPLADALGHRGLLERLVRAGAPLVPAGPGWSRVPPRLGRALAGSPDAQVAAAASSWYVGNGEVGAAVDTLFASGDRAGVARVLASLPSHLVDAFTYGELRAVVLDLPPEAVSANPEVLLHLARLGERAVDLDGRAAALAQVEAIAAGQRSAVLAARVAAEVVRDLARDGRADEAERVAAPLLRAEADDRARVRAMEGLALADLWRGDPRSTARAEERLQDALHLARRLGERGWEARMLQVLGSGLHWRQGRGDAALRCLDDAMALTTEVGQLRARIAVYRSEVLAEVGRREDAMADLVEAARLADAIGDETTRANVAWLRARLAAHEGDAAGCVTWLSEVERHPAEWFDHPGGIEFLAEAADLLDRVGDREGAEAYLARAAERSAADPALAEIPLFATGALAARGGDPAAALALLEQAQRSPEVAPRERWRTTLLRALAALRGGDRTTAGRLAAEALEQAAAAGLAGSVAFIERAAVAQLAPLVAEAPAGDGSRGAWVRVIGPFEVHRAGQSVELAPGRPRQLVAMLAAAGGRMGVEEAIEHFWPDEPSDVGRRRLRNVLARVRAGAGELVVRDGESLSLAAGTRVDAWELEAHTRAALAEPPERRLAAARMALADVAGEALEDFRYEGWATGRRERVRQHRLALLDTIAAAAEAAGATDDSLAALDAAIEIDPWDEQRYVRMARLLVAAGRLGTAHGVIERARSALAELGLELSVDLDRIRTAST